MKKQSQKTKLSLIFFILMLLAGVIRLLWLLVGNDFHISYRPSQSGDFLTLIATVLFILSSIVGIVLAQLHMQKKK